MLNKKKALDNNQGLKKKANLPKKRKIPYTQHKKRKGKKQFFFVCLLFK